DRCFRSREEVTGTHEPGRAGLKRRPTMGRPCRLAEAQWTMLAGILSRGAVAAGFGTERWTLSRIAHVVERELGVQYPPRSLGRVLRAHGWSPQRPAPRARAERGPTNPRPAHPSHGAPRARGTRRSSRRGSSATGRASS